MGLLRRVTYNAETAEPAERIGLLCGLRELRVDRRQFEGYY
jgi:hypothetical protein